MKLGIIGHETRGNEVIKILEMLGGKNLYSLTGCVDNQFYIMDNVIYSLYIGPDEIKGYKIFSLDEFLEKYPYKVGDKVNVWTTEGWSGRADIETSKITSMRWNSDRNEVAYRLKDIIGEFYTDDMGKVNDEENLFHTTNEYEEIVAKSFQGGYEKCKLDIQLNGYELPDGYHFTDEKGNVIDTTKILIKKNPPTYPTNYDECLDVLSMEYATHYNLRYFTYERGFYEYATTDKLCSLQDKLNILGKLIICRNAYWKIAGDELGLGKPWEPDFDNLSTTHEFIKIDKGCFYYSIKLLVFPTVEIRDAFYNNFKFLIEQCKELL